MFTKMTVTEQTTAQRIWLSASFGFLIIFRAANWEKELRVKVTEENFLFSKMTEHLRDIGRDGLNLFSKFWFSMKKESVPIILRPIWAFYDHKSHDMRISNNFKNEILKFLETTKLVLWALILKIIVSSNKNFFKFIIQHLLKPNS